MDQLTMRQWRLVKEMSIEAAAEACGVHPNTYAYWEKKPENVKVKDAVKVAQALGVSVKVKLCEPKTIQRSEGKAKRVIDNRNL